MPALNAVCSSAGTYSSTLSASAAAAYQTQCCTTVVGPGMVNTEMQCDCTRSLHHHVPAEPACISSMLLQEAQVVLAQMPWQGLCDLNLLICLLLSLPCRSCSGVSSPRLRNSPRKANQRHGPHFTSSTSSPLAPQAGFAPGHFNISASAGHSRSTSEMTTPYGSTSTLATSTIPAVMPPGYGPAATFSAYGGEGVKPSGWCCSWLIGGTQEAQCWQFHCYTNQCAGAVHVVLSSLHRMCLCRV